MQCPSCRSDSLLPVKLQSRLPARQCENCHGILIDLLSYREWAEINKNQKQNVERKLREVEDTSKAIICPKCSKIMLKFRISGETSNKVDVCQYCDEAWLDDGEWELLGSLEIQHKLNAIFTTPWQNRIREEGVTKAREERFKEMFGVDEYKKLSEFKNWIDCHPRKEDVIRYLVK